MRMAITAAPLPVAMQPVPRKSLKGPVHASTRWLLQRPRLQQHASPPSNTQGHALARRTCVAAATGPLVSCPAGQALIRACSDCA